MSNPNITGFGDRNRPLSDSGVAPEDDVFVQTRPTKDPRNEGFFEMLRLNVSPNLRWYSFAVILTFLLLVIFGVQVGVDGLLTAALPKTFLPINISGPFTGNLGLAEAFIKTKYQFWRYLSALFLHLNATHLLSSIVSLLIWASLFERLISPLRLVLYYFLGGVVGLIFASSLASSGDLMCGATAGIFAIFGGSLGFLIFNWKNMEAVPSRLSWMVIIIFIMVISLLFSFGSGNLLEQLGGFLAGLSVGLALSAKYLPRGAINIGNTSHESIFVFLGIGFLGLLTLIPMALIFFTK